MIIKSMSRKEPSFGQLAAYMSDEKSDRAFDLHQHVFTRDPQDIAAEFEENARRLGKRKGGNYLFHEILSIDTRLCGQSREVKEKLRLLALEYIGQRCPRSMVYGALHRDHEGHLHYHLMISANERGDNRRQRLTPGQFNTHKREIERLACEQYPELKQGKVMDVSNAERDARRSERKSRKEQEMKKRGVTLTRKEQLAQELRSLLAYAGSQAEFERLLRDKGYEFYTRGKIVGVRPLSDGADGKKPRAHRFNTLGVMDAYEAFRAGLDEGPDRGGFEGEKEKERENDRGAEREDRGSSEHAERSSDNLNYVKNEGDQEPDHGAGERQDPEDELSDVQREWKARADARQAHRKSKSRDGPDREQ